MTVGERIAQLRKEHTLSQEELGEQLNVSRQAIYKWERNASLPEIEKWDIFWVWRNSTPSPILQPHPAN